MEQLEVVEISGLQVGFEVMAWDEHEQIGKGRHLRVIIQTERFLKRVASKSRPNEISNP